MNGCANYRLFGGCRINRARIVTEAARGLNGWMHDELGWLQAQLNQHVRVLDQLLIDQTLQDDAVIRR